MNTTTTTAAWRKKGRRRFRIGFWTWTHRVVQLLFLLALIWGASGVYPHLIGGSATATRILDRFALADPLAAIEITLARRAWSPQLWLAAIPILLFYVLAGRAYCAWICPLGLALELNQSVRDWVQRRLRRRHRKLPEFSLDKRTKYGVLAAALALSLFTSLPVFLLISPINIFARAFIYGFDIAFWLIVFIALVEWIAPRLWCRSLCPLGAFYSLLGHFRVVGVNIDQVKEQAAHCHLCSYNCPMGIEIVKEHIEMGRTAITDPECTSCGVCVDHCPRGVLGMGFSLPWKRRKERVEVH